MIIKFSGKAASMFAKYLTSMGDTVETDTDQQAVDEETKKGEEEKEKKSRRCVNVK